MNEFENFLNGLSELKPVVSFLENKSGSYSGMSIRPEDYDNLKDIFREQYPKNKADITRFEIKIKFKEYDKSVKTTTRNFSGKIEKKKRSTGIVNL